MFEMSFSKHDLEVVENLINSDDFANYILGHTTALQQAGFILQTLVDKCEEVKTELNAPNEDKIKPIAYAHEKIYPEKL